MAVVEPVGVAVEAAVGGNKMSLHKNLAIRLLQNIFWRLDILTTFGLYRINYFAKQRLEKRLSDFFKKSLFRHE